jgi:hypothetical protein
MRTCLGPTSHGGSGEAYPVFVDRREEELSTSKSAKLAGTPRICAVVPEDGPSDRAPAI